MTKKAVLLVNLGSPDSPSVQDVRRYLREFLMDGRVLDTPWPVRFCVVNFAILPKRPKESAHAYSTVWTPEGSPLLVWTDKVFAATPALWDEARDHGLRVGWAQSSLDGFGVGGMLTLSRPTEPLGATRKLDAVQLEGSRADRVVDLEGKELGGAVVDERAYVVRD